MIPATVAAVAVAAAAVFDPTGTWTVSATGHCFGAAAYSDGEAPQVGNDFVCSRNLARFSPPQSDTIAVTYDPVSRSVTLNGGPSHMPRRIRLDAEGFGTSTESYRNETGEIDPGCSIHSFFSEVVQFKDARMIYTYVDNSEFVAETPESEDSEPSTAEGQSSCDPSIAKLRTALNLGRASPGTLALLQSGALEMTRLMSLQQTSIHYLYEGVRAAPTR